MDVELIVSLHSRALFRRQEEVAARIALLTKDQRQDEANLLKAKRNVYGNLGDALAAFGRQGHDVLNRYEELMQHLDAVWNEAAELAARYQDARRLAVEEVKLEALKDVMALLREETREGEA